MKNRTLTSTSLDLLDYFGSVSFELTYIYDTRRLYRKYILEIRFNLKLRVFKNYYFEL